MVFLKVIYLVFLIIFSCFAQGSDTWWVPWLVHPEGIIKQFGVSEKIWDQEDKAMIELYGFCMAEAFDETPQVGTEMTGEFVNKGLECFDRMVRGYAEGLLLHDHIFPRLVEKQLKEVPEDWGPQIKRLRMWYQKHSWKRACTLAQKYSTGRVETAAGGAEIPSPYTWIWTPKGCVSEKYQNWFLRWEAGNPDKREVYAVTRVGNFLATVSKGKNGFVLSHSFYSGLADFVWRNGVFGNPEANSFDYAKQLEKLEDLILLANKIIGLYSSEEMHETIFGEPNFPSSSALKYVTNRGSPSQELFDQIVFLIDSLDMSLELSVFQKKIVFSIPGFLDKPFQAFRKLASMNFDQGIFMFFSSPLGY